MSDQADKLRQLVVDALPRLDGGGALPPTIVVTGGKGGVGATTVAVNLAAELVHGGRRAVLVDAAPHADSAQLLGVEIPRGESLDDVLISACSAVDALRNGPEGISLLAGRWAAEAAVDRSPRACDRLVDHLQTLGPHADALVIDSGSGFTTWTRQLWQRADLVLLVTTPEDDAVMDSYATIKHSLTESVGDLRILVNQADDTAIAVDVQSRLAAASRRFLGRTLARAPWLPRHFADSFAGGEAPLAWEVPASAFGRAVNQLGRFATDFIAQSSRASRVSCELLSC